MGIEFSSPQFEKRTFVAFYMPGTMFDETTFREVVSRDIDDFPDEFPWNAFAYQYYDSITCRVFYKGEWIVLNSGAVNRSPMHYIGGTVMNREDVEREVANNETLLFNMSANKWTYVIRTCMGNFKPFDPDKDIILDY